MPSPRRSLRILTTLLALVALVGLTATACSKDDEKSKDKTTTTEKDDKSDDEQSDDKTTTTSSDDTTEDTVSEEEFTAAMEKTTSALESAKDACEVIDSWALISDVGTPSGEEQNKQAVDLLVLMVNRAADYTEDAATADRMRASAKEFADYAEENGYSDESIDFGGEGPDLEAYQTMNEDMSAFGTAHPECMDMGTGDTGTGDTSTTAAP